MIKYGNQCASRDLSCDLLKSLSLDIIFWSCDTKIAQPLPPTMFCCFWIHSTAHRTFVTLSSLSPKIYYIIFGLRQITINKVMVCYEESHPESKFTICWISIPIMSLLLFITLFLNEVLTYVYLKIMRKGKCLIFI